MPGVLDRIRNGPPLVADGGMGPLLSAAAPRLRCPEEANLRAPDTVVSLHLSFINAGAELIETNTFGANRPKLAARYLEDDFAAINEAGVKLARDARQVSGREVFIAGSIGPLGENEEAWPEDRGPAFVEQARLLAGRGVDLFMVETFFDLEELVTAIEAVRSVSDLPVVALLTFGEDAETIGGVGAAQAAERLAALDVAAIGANHGAGPASALTALQAMGGRGRPLAALPNIGLASMSGGRVIYPHAAPEYFAEFAAHARELGATVIGGCCGTTPTEIGAIRRALDDDRAPRAPLEVAAAIHEAGIGAYVDVNDNATARVGMNPLIVSAAIERMVGIETIPHLTPRDTTVMGLEAVLLGAHAEGIRNVLAVTGDPPDIGDYAESGGVYEVDAIGLTHLIAQLNRGENFNGKAIDAPTSFFTGVALNPNADDPDLELDRFRRKIDAGARFAMTQIVYDVDQLDRFLDRLGGPSPIPIVLGVFPLTSYRLALRLHNEVPGIVVPDELQEQLREAGPRESEVGFAHARELLAATRDRAAGVYVVAPYKKPLSVLELIL